MECLEKVHVVMEAGYCWQPLYYRLEETGHDVCFVYPKEVKALTKRKTDRTDSKPLPTFYEQTCYLNPPYHPETQG
jgi:transposase